MLYSVRLNPSLSPKINIVGQINENESDILNQSAEQTNKQSILLNDKSINNKKKYNNNMKNQLETHLTEALFQTKTQKTTITLLVILNIV